MLKKTLILPFAIEDEESLRREDWLSRQLPALLRNTLEKDKPGLMTASPLAAENDGRRTWIVHRRRWEPAEAARFASERHYERVVVGQVVGSPSPGGIRQVEVLAVDAQTSEVLADIRLEGDLIQVSRELLERLAFLVDLRPEGAAARLEPGTRSALAFEHYLRGLDVLLTLRSPGIDLERPDGAIEPFEAA
ncbi:MAG: hypothetical protein KDB53_20135, partial [Planctomycetes bacterium]|nr:hypothetical protein [Planctomycetota bacterium]